MENRGNWSNDMENMEENSEKIRKIWNKSKLNGEMIGKIWKKGNLNPISFHFSTYFSSVFSKS
jgi:hypothetical protein